MQKIQFYQNDFGPMIRVTYPIHGSIICLIGFYNDAVTLSFPDVQHLA